MSLYAMTFLQILRNRSFVHTQYCKLLQWEKILAEVIISLINAMKSVRIVVYLASDAVR